MTTDTSAEAFSEMARRISANRGEPFGGAFVVVLPDGTSHDLMVMGTANEPAVFLSMLSTKITIIQAELEIEEGRKNGQAGYGGRR